MNAVAPNSQQTISVDSESSAPEVVPIWGRKLEVPFFVRHYVGLFGLFGFVLFAWAAFFPVAHHAVFAIESRDVGGLELITVALASIMLALALAFIRFEKKSAAALRDYDAHALRLSALRVEELADWISCAKCLFYEDSVKASPLLRGRAEPMARKISEIAAKAAVDYAGRPDFGIFYQLATLLDRNSPDSSGALPNISEFDGCLNDFVKICSERVFMYPDEWAELTFFRNFLRDHPKVSIPKFLSALPEQGLTKPRTLDDAWKNVAFLSVVSERNLANEPLVAKAFLALVRSYAESSAISSLWRDLGWAERIQVARMLRKSWSFWYPEDRLAVFRAMDCGGETVVTMFFPILDFRNDDPIVREILKYPDQSGDRRLLRRAVQTLRGNLGNGPVSDGSGHEGAESGGRGGIRVYV